MGMYTELYLSVEFKPDLPTEVVMVIEHLFALNKPIPPILPEHDFFKCPRWSMIGRCSSYYFVPFSTSNLYYDERVTNQYYLTTRSDLKNYDGEIAKFLDWVMPYLDHCEEDHIGHYRYEEDDEPTLIYFKKQLSTQHGKQMSDA